MSEAAEHLMMARVGRVPHVMCIWLFASIGWKPADLCATHGLSRLLRRQPTPNPNHQPFELRVLDSLSKNGDRVREPASHLVGSTAARPTPGREIAVEDEATGKSKRIAARLSMGVVDP